MSTTTTHRSPPAERSNVSKTRNINKTPVVDAPPRPEVQTLFDLRKKPGYYNAAARAALLRRTQQAPHDELLVDFSRGDCFIELRAGGSPLLGGTWSFQATASGQPLASAGPWEESCWESDDQCDYLEIELPLSGGWRLQRQMLLARRDRFLLLADALLSPVGNTLRSVPHAANVPHSGNGSAPPTASAEAHELHYAGSISLAPTAAFQPAAETREGWLESKNRRLAGVIPLALPEWRAEFSHAELSSEGGRLTLAQKALGRNLYAPLWIDLDPRRLRRPLTWRRITVAENLAAVSRETAAGFRVQSGAEQWLAYRSLAKAGSRSFLGHNTLYEFVCRRFLATGDTEPIIEIE